MKILKMEILSLALALLVTGAVANAASKTYRYPYGMAGCGLGSLVSEKNDKLSQIAAWVVNYLGYGICAGPTSAITTGTSNCTDRMEETSAMEREVFVKANLARLTQEAAQGTGDHLDAFAQVMGCEDENRVTFAKFSQANYSKIFTSEKPEEVLQNYVSEMQKDDTLSTNCSMTHT